MQLSSTTLSLQETFRGRILLAALFALLLMTPIQGHAQQGLPPQDNPHGDLSDPMLPPPGIIGVALHLTAERIGDPAGLFIRGDPSTGTGSESGACARAGNSGRGRPVRQRQDVPGGRIHDTGRGRDVRHAPRQNLFRREGNDDRSRQRGAIDRRTENLNP